MADDNWPSLAEYSLFEELLDARKQGFDYMGLRWKEENMWGRICMNLNKRTTRKYGIDAIKNRVDWFTRCYEIMGDKLFEKKHELQYIGPDVLKKKMDLGPPSVPKPSTTTLTTSKKSAKLLEFRDVKLFQELSKARKQDFNYICLDWKDDLLWTRLCMEVDRIFVSSKFIVIDKDDVKDRVRAYKNGYKKFGTLVFKNQIPEMTIMGLEVLGAAKDIGPPIIHQTRTSTSTSNGKCSRETSNIESTAHDGCKRAGCS